jgi:hypothetical protein
MRIDRFTLFAGFAASASSGVALADATVQGVVRIGGQPVAGPG